jgi:hypothetical protein
MGELWSIIQGHLDRYGVREAAFARRMDTSSQTINSWKMRGLRRLPEKWLLEAVARETGTPYANVLHAALLDTGYLSDGVNGEPASSAERETGPAPARAPHSTTVSAQDIAAGATLPPAAPVHRRTPRSTGTRPRQHK